MRKKRVMTERRRLLFDQLNTPIGRLALLADENGQLRAVGWTEGHVRMQEQLARRSRDRDLPLVPATNPGGLTARLIAYFEGDLAAIDGLSVAIAGTDFQRAVWRVLREIPCGETCSYRELARRVGKPAAVRAVGAANRSNPVAIVVPCHRVIGANGSLTGYGGGLHVKKALLELEGATLFR